MFAHSDATIFYEDICKLMLNVLTDVIHSDQRSQTYANLHKISKHHKTTDN